MIDWLMRLWRWLFVRDDELTDSGYGYGPATIPQEHDE